MTELEGVGTSTAQVKRKIRGPKQGDEGVLRRVFQANQAVIDATQALLQERATRSMWVQEALDMGWSVRGLAQALGVDKSWVQRAMGQD
jgi:hypothetical protein